MISIVLFNLDKNYSVGDCKVSKFTPTDKIKQAGNNGFVDFETFFAYFESQSKTSVILETCAGIFLFIFCYNLWKNHYLCTGY
jgi:hypothetical protein